MGGILAVLDSELNYANCLMNYLNKNHSGFQVSVFSILERFNQFLKLNSVDILLIGNSFDLSGISEERVKKIVILNSLDNSYDLEYDQIYKYQPASEILKKLLLLYADLDDKGLNQKMESNFNIGNITTVCTLLGGEGTHNIIREVIHFYKCDENTLFLDLHMFPEGKSAETDRIGGMSDLIYYIKERKDNFLLKFKALLIQYEGVDGIGPVKYAMDLCEMTKEDLVFLLEQVRKYGAYDRIVIAVDYFDRTIFQLFQSSDRICFIRGGGFNKSMDDFYAHMITMEQLNCIEFEEKTRIIDSPLNGSEWIHKALSSEKYSTLG